MIDVTLFSVLERRAYLMHDGSRPKLNSMPNANRFSNAIQTRSKWKNLKQTSYTDAQT